MTPPPRRFATRLLCGVLANLLFWAPAAQVAYAQDPEGEYTYSGSEAEIREEYRDALRNEQIPESLRDELNVRELRAIEDAPADSPADSPTATPISLPGGQQASAVTPQAISLPNAEGSVEGMGESFSPVLSSGTATFSVPIAVAPGRAGVQPSLALSYSTTGGNGPVGFGWGVGAPFISRQTDRGLPHYIDGPAWHAEEDRFMYNGGQELVPVDTAAIGIVDGQANNGTAPAVPTELASWQQYRARVEGGFMRFFRSPDSLRWVVQSKDGTRFDFGALPTGQGPSEAVTNSLAALERDPEMTTGGVYRWTLTRMSDPHGSSVYYLYDQHEGHSYLRDIYYVSPHSCAASTPDATRQCPTSLSSYAARVRLVYEPRQDIFTSYVAGWRIETARRLKRVEVTAYNDGAGARTLVRRYHLTYASDSFHSLLEQVRVEGRRQTLNENGVHVGDATTVESSLTDAIVGELLPPMRFTYTRMPAGGIPGFGTIDGTVHEVANSPPHSVDEGRSDLFDVNSDGLPDLIVTDPARYRTATGGPAVGVFFNGFTGSNARPAGAAAHFSGAVPMPMSAGLSSVLNLSNLNVVPMDIDGDGRSDLLHMPRLRTYGWWAPTRQEDAEVASVSPAQQGWAWTYAQIDLPAGDTDPRIDLGRDGQHIRIMDVNNDHLIDVVRTTGTVMQTWINLGFLPGGDGRFGSYEWSGTQWSLSTLPFESCLLHAGTPIDFEDPEVRLADLNGDGLQDIAKVRRGRIIYWPGRGEGVWGEGSRECARGEGAGRYIEMATPPPELAIDLDGVFLEDVNMDGASDIVQVRFREVDVYFNRAGHGWTPRTTVRNTPATPAFAPRIRFADIDGSSTTDIVWGNAHAWEYIDPAGGRRPRLLVGVENGLGAQTTIEYGSSADDYLSDLQAADTCTSCPDRFTWGEVRGEPDARLQALSGQSVYRSAGSPVISTVVRSVSTTDRFDVLGREAQVTESRFAYHDGYYEGIEQEFRGFGAADALTVGDWNNPTVYSRTHFLQGRRPSDIADDRLADNPNEALKGREVMTEVFDEAGTFLSTSWATLTNRRLHTGLDGRTIHYAFVSESNELRYNTSPFVAGSTTMGVPAVMREEVDPDDGSIGAATQERARTVAIRAEVEQTARIRTTFDVVDNLGHVHQQTAHGQVGVQTATPMDDAIVSCTDPVLKTAAAWIWRTGRSYLSDGACAAPTVPAPAGALGLTVNAYDEVGDLVSATQTVTSSHTYTFAGETGDGDAVGFTQPTNDDDNLVASTRYDKWGNAEASCAGLASAPATFNTGCLRYGRVVYDDDYAQLAMSEHLQVSASQTLIYEGTWDRGLGAIRSSTDVRNSLSTSVTYDGLGRLTSVTPPSIDGSCGTPQPTTTIAYELTASPATQPISRVITTTRLDCAGAETLVSMGYVDGLGRARASLSTGETPGTWVRSGITTLDKKGTVRRTYQTDLYSGSETAWGAVVAPAAGIPYATTRYDAFGRAKGVHAEDNSVTWTSYHALSTDVCDPLDNAPSSEHYRTCTRADTDGHGRVIDQRLRNRNPDTGAAETYRLWTYYRADGAVLALVRAQASEETGRPASWTSGLPENHVVRTFDYDSVGRRLSSDDPDTDNPTDTDDATNSWRYLFNRVGDLAAVRDPRGCGQNFFYDYGGRLVGEQYVSCGEAQSHAAELPPAENQIAGLISADGYTGGAVFLDAVYHYDTYPTWGDPLVPAGSSGVVGRATGVSDRAQRAVLAYDDRGNVIWTARQMALISDHLALGTLDTSSGRPSQLDIAPTTPTDVEYDETNTYTRTATFDHAGRPLSMTLPTDPDYDPVVDPPEVGGLLTYNRRGLPATAAATIDDVPQTIVAAIEYLRDGLVASITYGDDFDPDGTGTDPARSATVSTTTYDIRRRPIRFRTTRDSTGAPGSLGAVETVVDQQLVWDAANNLVAQLDHRDGGEWPAGHRPQSVNIRHDALYRVIGAEYDYTQANGSRTTVDEGTDWRDNYLDYVREHDPMVQNPAAMVSAEPDDRVVSLTWSWDYLANTTDWTDDANSFYERSLGAIQNGDALSADLRPSALYLASNIGNGSNLDGGSGWVEVDYGVGGNVTAMTVHSQCDDAPSQTCADPGGELGARRDALRDGCACAVEQHYVYRWDELNRLDEARRYDRAGSSWELKVRQRYRYDASNQRTVKQTLHQGKADCTPLSAPCERVALYVYPGDFERRGLRTGSLGYAADPVIGTETQYVVAGARTVWKHTPVETEGYDRDHRFTVGLTDLIQTTAAVIDVRTGELLETSTYYPNGARETYLVDPATATAPEVAGFTGKEADEEVGVVYFGERYLIPRLGRWASADPLHVHAVGGGEALNSYHYVAGNLLAGRDPMGLDDIEVNTAPPGVRPGERFFISETGTGTASTYGSASEFESAASGTQTYIYNPEAPRSLEFTRDLEALAQRLRQSTAGIVGGQGTNDDDDEDVPGFSGDDEPGDALSAAVTVASYANLDFLDNPGCGESTCTGGVPGGTGDSENAFLQLIYLLATATDWASAGAGALENRAARVAREALEDAADESADLGRRLARDSGGGVEPPATTPPGGGGGGGGGPPREVYRATDDGIVLPPGDHNLVPTTADPTGWIQIHQTHEHGGLGTPHTHRPVFHQGPNGRGRVERVAADTTESDIREVDRRLRSGEIRRRTDRSDRGGP